VQTLRFIHRARNLGFTLREVAGLVALYRDQGRASRLVKRRALQHVADLDRKIAEMRAIRDAISHLAERCRGEDRPECPVIDDFEAAGR
jgi:MerR family transcriptional regulator, copper efflux regulator